MWCGAVVGQGKVAPLLQQVVVRVREFRGSFKASVLTGRWC